MSLPSQLLLNGRASIGTKTRRIHTEVITAARLKKNRHKPRDRMPFVSYWPFQQTRPESQARFRRCRLRCCTLFLLTVRLKVSYNKRCDRKAGDTPQRTHHLGRS